MSAMQNPPNATEDEFEGPTTIFSPIEKIKDIKKWAKTRKAILNGEQLYNCNAVALSSMGLMGPWKFNVVQSFICSLPGSILAIVLWLMPPRSDVTADPIPGQILSVLTPFIVPFTLLLTVYAVAYCSLPRGQLTAFNWKAAQRKYLYLDASYDAKPQLIIATCVAAIALSRYDYEVLTWIGALALVCIYITSVIMICVTRLDIRDLMFRYDYLAGPAKSTTLKRPSLIKFHAFTSVASIATLAIVSIFQYAIAHGLARLVAHIRGS